MTPDRLRLPSTPKPRGVSPHSSERSAPAQTGLRPSSGTPQAKGPLTVGRLRDLLAEYHESDVVLTSDQNLLYRLKVGKYPTMAGVVVLIEKGDRHVF